MVMAKLNHSKEVVPTDNDRQFETLVEHLCSDLGVTKARQAVFSARPSGQQHTQIRGLPTQSEESERVLKS